MKSLEQQQQQALSQTVNLERNATANTLLSSAAASSNVHRSVAAHLSAQANVEQQQQAKQIIGAATASAAIPTSMSGRLATGITELQRTSVQPLSSTASQLYNDFRNAEQMRKELDESVRQLEAQQKLVRYIFC